MRAGVGGKSYSVQFKANGSKITIYLGHERDGWSADRAESERARLAEDFGRGLLETSRRRTGHGYVARERKKHGTLYSLRFKVDKIAYTVSLGREADGWSLELAELERMRISAEIDAGTWEPPIRRGHDPIEFEARKCREAVQLLSDAIERFERRTGKEAPPKLNVLREAGRRLVSA